MSGEPRDDARRLESLVLAVFKKEGSQAHHKDGLDVAAVNEFARSDDAIEEARQFQKKILTLWKHSSRRPPSPARAVVVDDPVATSGTGITPATPRSISDGEAAEAASNPAPVHPAWSDAKKWQPAAFSGLGDGLSSPDAVSAGTMTSSQKTPMHAVPARASDASSGSALSEPVSAQAEGSDGESTMGSRALQPIDLGLPPVDAASPAEAPQHPATTASAPLAHQPSGSAMVNPAATPGVVPRGETPSGRPIEPKVVFSVPNAKAGEPYRAKIEGKGPDGCSVEAKNARTDASGLVFDEATGELHGVPSQAGDFRINLQWRDERGAARSAECALVVTANPRDLWKEIAPDSSDPYFKPNEDSAFRELAGLRMAAASKRGRSHAHNGTFRDDDFFVDHCASSGWSVLIVADGAGSARSSRKGSEIAVRKAGEHIVSELSAAKGAELALAIEAWEADASTGAKPLKDNLYYLLAKAAHSAVLAIDQEAQAKQAVFKDYSTTLLAAIHRKVSSGVFVASFWLGDGAIGAYGGANSVYLMGTPDSGEFAGQTRFLDKAAVHDAQGLWNRIVFNKFDTLTALILMTDGISDPRFETDNGLVDAAKWDALWAEIAPMLQGPEPEKRLVEWLDFFTPGHHDDRTIALLW